ncbi:MAG: hypothetical protein ACYTGL_16360 [Planctomycetota bacterium]|jgi:hypothetical protein
MSVPGITDWADRLVRLGLSVQNQIVTSLRRSAESGDFAGAVAVAEESGDRIYELDRSVEPILVSAIRDWPTECFPLVLIAEGFGEDGTLWFSAPGVEPVADAAEVTARWRVIIDPIDGTRQLMYDKRPGWFLAAVTRDRGHQTSLSDSVASVLVELPTSRQSLADVFFAEAGESTRGLRIDCNPEVTVDDRLQSAMPIPVRPSQANDLTDGFLTVVGCFPGTRRLAADLAERIAERLDAVTSLPQFFDDQYISTGGQMAQLMTGRDRCCIDLRPLFNRMLGRFGEDRFVEVHPYDAAGLLAAQKAGVVATDGFGRLLNAPLDVTTGLHWCGYANTSIQELIEPIIAEWLSDHGVASDSE